MRQVDRRLSTETRDVDYWTRAEADALIALREADFETWAKYTTSLVGRPGLEPGTQDHKCLI
jgi:hypothetical protein